jgi:hypothetical protein
MLRGVTYFFLEVGYCRHQWLTPEISATLEAEIRKIEV